MEMNKGRNGRTALSAPSTLPLSQTALAGLKPPDHPAAASWVLQPAVHAAGAVRTIVIGTEQERWLGQPKSPAPHMEEERVMVLEWERKG